MSPMTRPSPAEIERTILVLLERRSDGRTMCPSEAARALATDWRPLMQPVRDVAAAMAAQGRLEITQQGEVIDPREVHGPIRFRRL